MNDYRLLDGFNIPLNVEIAKEIGIKETILLQQIHYWCCKSFEKSDNYKDGHYWVYNSVEKWTEQLPWKSPTTTKDAIKALEARGLIIIGYYSYGNRNRTKWYRVDYDKVAELTLSFKSAKMADIPKKMSIRSDGICLNHQAESVRTKTYIKTNNSEINGDLPLTENPTTDDSLSKESNEFDNSTDDSEIDINIFIRWYYAEYAKRFGKNHPPLRADQRERVITNLTKFLNDPNYMEVDNIGLREMAKDFFITVDSNDWHIFHFVDHEILKYRFYNIYYRRYDP